MSWRSGSQQVMRHRQRGEDRRRGMRGMSYWLQMSNYFTFLISWSFSDPSLTLSVQCQSTLSGGKKKEGRGRLLLQIKCPGGNSNLLSFQRVHKDSEFPSVLCKGSTGKPNSRRYATEPLLRRCHGVLEEP